ncbi:MAG: GTPase ObgE [Bdellovibrionota bacterium]
MKFIDEATIFVKAGDGGKGASHFRREKYVPLGGPDGGDGGKGGDVIFVADRNKHTLLDFRFMSKWVAKSGEAGGTNRKTGKNGEDLIIKVPVGTQIFRVSDSALLVDLDEDEKSFVVAKGGRGGKGNAFFKSSTNQAPIKYQQGEVGEELEVLFSLKLVADVGLIGFPNAGKSTLISKVSASRPKIADYPFTTLVPNLGVVKVGDSDFVMADIPGLIPDASKGKGLGITFLKHVERCKILVHLIDVSILGSDKDIVEAYNKIRIELSAFSKLLVKKDEFIVFSKIDAVADKDYLIKAKEYFDAKGKEVFLISSVAGEGLKELLYRISQKIVG